MEDYDAPKWKIIIPEMEGQHSRNGIMIRSNRRLAFPNGRLAFPSGIMIRPIVDYDSPEMEDQHSRNGRLAYPNSIMFRPNGR